MQQHETPKDGTRVTRVLFFDKNIDGTYSIADILEKDCTCEEMANWLREGQNVWRNVTYKMECGYWHKGSAIYPWHETGLKFLASQFPKFPR